MEEDEVETVSEARSCVNREVELRSRSELSWTVLCFRFHQLGSLSAVYVAVLIPRNC